jgi:hypothetical protein
MYKHVESRPDWLAAGRVGDIYSLSGCISAPFADYINHWKHNGYWLFNSPAEMRLLAKEMSVSLVGTKLFYYEAYEQEYDEDAKTWAPYDPEPSFITNVALPKHKELEGYDVTTFTVHTSPECSPLSCNSLAVTIPTNWHCLFNTFDEARAALERGDFNDSEPGPFRIIAVHSSNDV